jgi:hypothetical protein
MSEGETSNGPRFVGGKSRSMRIDFEWPIEYGGMTYDHVNLRRLTAGEVAEWTREIASQAQSGLSLAWPVLRDDADLPIPAGLTDALDADDFDAVNKAVLDFLPRRFRGALASASAPQAGETTA